MRRAIDGGFDEVYQLAADMGGAGFVFTGDNDADIMHNSAQINLNVLEAARAGGVGRIFYSSSACMYPEYNQLDPDNPKCSEDSAYPAAPDSEYGWEKLFSERLYFAYSRNHGVDVRVARYHNIFGPRGVLERWAREGACGALQEGGHGGRRRQDRDVGRRTADAVVPLHRRMRRGDPAVDALRGHRCPEHRLRENGEHQPVRPNDHGVAGKKLAIDHVPGPPACVAAIPTTR